MCTTTRTVLWLLLILGAMVAVSRLPLWFRSNPWPDTSYRSFNSWDEAWVLPPRPSGAYTILLLYYKKDGGRLGRGQLKLTLVDETDDKVIPLTHDWEYGERGPFKDWQVEEIADFRAIEGHRYRIEVDPDQLKELAPTVTGLASI